jgi:capping protein beta
MSSPQDALRASLNVLRRVPPSGITTHLSALCALRPDLTEELLQRVDQPLTWKVCSNTKRKYVCSDYNRDGDSYRSPWSNAYEPPLADGITPPEGLRTMEVAANELLDMYRELYYAEGGGASCSSAYFWESGGRGFASCWLVHKEMRGSGGVWDAIHVLDVSPASGASEKDASGRPQYNYKLTTTVMLFLASSKPAAHGSMELGGNLTRQSTACLPVSAERGHVQNMGGMVEAMEGEVRAALDALYVSKTREVVASLRPRGGGMMAVGMVGMNPGAGSGGAGSGGGGAFVSDLSAAIHKRGAGGAGGAGTA